MKLLLDTRIFLGIIDEKTSRLGSVVETVLDDPDAEFHLSVASIWEIAIKFRLGKLPLRVELGELSLVAGRFGIAILPIAIEHVIAELRQYPPTNDPFDRLLLAQCQIEGFRLVTVDRALTDHPLAALR